MGADGMTMARERGLRPAGAAGAELGAPATLEVVGAGGPTAEVAAIDVFWAPDTAYTRWAKPALDRVAAAVLLVLLSPLIAAVALSVRLRLGPGVLFRQERIGQRGRTFEVLKFRTMQHDRRSGDVAPYQGPERRRSHKVDHDPRHTPLGRRLRSLSLDELPQLWNVLRGDMALVGPRPELVSVAAGWEPWRHLRHAVRPGLTGLWQVTRRGGGDGRMTAEDALIDLEYVRTVSLRTDLGILLRTPLAVLGASGR